jgi:RNA polymerase sigma-70 factor (ECF subfamily)
MVAGWPTRMSKHVLNTRLPPAASREEARMRGAMLEEEPLTQDDRRDSNEDAIFNELYRSEGPKLVRILSRQTNNKDEARDLVQDVFYRFTRVQAKWPAALERPQAYLRRIAANLLKDRAKAASRHSAALHIVADEEALPGMDQHGLLESRDMLRRLETAMMRLRPRTREIFMAHRIHGETYQEIAERTGLSVKGVEKQMSKALVQLDQFLHRS